MSRSVFHAPSSLTKQEIFEIAESILKNDGYKQIEREGEIVWKKGTGAMTAMHFIMLDYNNNELLITGWVQIGIGSAGLSDMDLTGFLGSIPKKSTYKTIQKIRKAIM